VVFVNTEFNPVIMAILRSRCGHYIFIMWLLLRSSLWPTYVIGQAIYIFILSFVLLLSFLLSSPNLSGRRLDVCHTSTYGVAFARIKDAGLKRAARGSLEMQDAKNPPKSRHLCTIVQLCPAISSQLKHVSTIGKKFVKQQYLLHIP